MDMQDPATLGSAEALYTRMEAARGPVLKRARAAAQLTIPTLLPPEGYQQGEALYSPHQSVGAEGVNNISSKLLLALMQPGSPFFRVAPTNAVAQELQDLPEDDPYRTEIEKSLSLYERMVMHDVEDKGDRTVIFEAIKHIVVAGNCLFFQDKEGARIWHLDRFCVRRDPMGAVMDIVIKEEHSYDSLDDDVREMLPSSMNHGSNLDQSIAVYTHVSRKKNQWFEYQEVAGQRIPSTEAQYPLDRSPYIPMRLTRVSGQSYGEGYVGQYFGDLSSLESLSQSLVEGSAAMAKILFLVKPNGTTNAKTLNNSPNGAIREGNAADVTVVQSDKNADMREVGVHADKLERRLARVFLLDSVVQRDAERVTAEEIRRMSQMLEDSLGGVYSALTQDFQLPYLHRRIALMQRSGELPKLPKGMTRVTIVTGIEALGRGHDRNRLLNWVTTLGQVMPSVLETDINKRAFAERLAIADGIDTEGLLISQAEKQAVAAKQEQQAMMSSVMPEAAKAMGGMAQTAMANGQLEIPQG